MVPVMVIARACTGAHTAPEYDAETLLLLKDRVPHWI